MIDICHITALAVQALRVAIPCLLVSMVVSPTGGSEYAEHDP